MFLIFIAVGYFIQEVIIIKRLFALILIFLSVFLASCSQQEYGVLPFEGKEVLAECTVNGKFKVKISKSATAASLEVIAPSEISGISFSFSDTGDYMYMGDTEIPVDRDSLTGTYAIATLFNINEAMMTSAVSRDGVGELCFNSGDTEYTLFFDKEGYITDAKIISPSFEYEIEIEAIKIT